MDYIKKYFEPSQVKASLSLLVLFLAYIYVQFPALFNKTTGAHIVLTLLGVCVLVFILYETSISYPQVSWLLVCAQVLYYLYALHNYNLLGYSSTERVNNAGPVFDEAYNWAKKWNL